MAPLDPDAVSRSNALPLAVLLGQGALVTGLTAHILHTIYQARRSLPPAQATRAQQSIRNRNASIFSVLALLSLASVTTFAVAWRLLSYFEWAEKGKHEHPDGIWTGWYGTGEEGVGRWRLGDWWSDVDIIDSTYAKVLAAPESFMYLYQHFTGITSAAIFFGVEGRRRNLDIKTIAAFVGLSVYGSLGLSLNLFFVWMLFTPMATHSDDSHRHDALFAPYPSVFYIPVIGAFLVEQCLPYLLASRADLTPFRFIYTAVPLFLAFIPEFAPKKWGQTFTTKADAHRSYVRAFYILGVTAFAISWKQFFTMALVNTPPEPNSFRHAYDLFKNAISKNTTQKPNRFMQGLENTAQMLKTVSTHPAISVTAMDVLITAISLLLWTFLRQLEVSDILDNSFLSFLADKKEDAVEVKEEEEDEEIDDVPQISHYVSATDPVTPNAARKRGPGRPRKSTPATTEVPLPDLGSHKVTKEVPLTIEPASSTSPSTATEGLRRSSRRRAGNRYAESEASMDSTYEPEKRTSEELEQTEIDKTPGTSTEELLEGGESTALALAVGILGGVGQLAASVLGAEVTGAT